VIRLFKVVEIALAFVVAAAFIMTVLFLFMGAWYDISYAIHQKHSTLLGSLFFISPLALACGIIFGLENTRPKKKVRLL
jgi:hypothetical protein